MTTMLARSTERAVDELVGFLETGQVSEGLFAADVFCDFTPPCWRIQAQGRDDVVAQRRASHPAPGRVTVRRVDPTATGFVLEIEERWDADGERWYSRELIRADLQDGAITDVAVYCTGDWDAALVARHAQAVTLIRP